MCRCRLDQVAAGLFTVLIGGAAEKPDRLVDLLIEPGRRLVVASSDGYGFIVAEDECLATTRKGKQVLNVRPPAEAQALAMGLIESGQAMSQQVRAQATLSLIMQKTDRFAGDFANTLGTSLPNQSKKAEASIEELQARLDQQLFAERVQAAARSGARGTAPRRNTVVKW